MSVNVAIRPRRMTRDEFFSWAQAQDARFEFDGSQPVAMTGGTVSNSIITNNIHRALFGRLQGGRCVPLDLTPASPPSGTSCAIQTR